MSYQPGDKVLHPKRPEWGVGTILPKTTEQIWVVHFSTAGEKQLRRDLVVFDKWDPNSGKPEIKSELKSFAWQEKPSYQPKFFVKEFSYAYPPRYEKDFIEGPLALEWSRKWPILFDELDVEALGYNNKAKFYHWMAAVLSFANLGWNSTQIHWNRLEINNRKQLLVDLWGEEFVGWTNQFREEFSAAGLPTVVGYDTVFHRRAMIWIKEEDEIFIPDQIRFIKGSVKDFGVENYLIRVRPRAKFET